MSLDFRESDHSYFWKGKQVPSVTEVLEDIFPVSNFAKNEKAATFGKHLHLTIHLHEMEKLKSFHPNLKPWFMGYIRFMDEIGNIAALQNKNLVLDWKSGVFSKRWFFQMAAYEQLAKENIKTIKGSGTETKFYSKQYGYAGTVDKVVFLGERKRWINLAIQLVPNSYKLFFPKNPQVMNFNKFLSILNVYKMKTNKEI